MLTYASVSVPVSGMLQYFLALFLALIIPSVTAPAQVRPPRDTSMAGMQMPGMKMPGMPMDSMTMTRTLDIPMNRAASGTAWNPDAVSLPSREFMRGQWSLTLHGFAFAQLNTQSGPRGDTQLGSVNWGMLMASRSLAGGVLELRGMLSLDAAGVTSRGYPLLLQSGETYHGEPLHDRQHPHDALMELGIGYTRALGRNIAMQLYVAPSGEPALGTVAFMHRPSAMDDPVAPIAHHWQDATHVSFGVTTVGLFTRRWKLEGSAFNAREPDENRWNLEHGALDSYSGRLTVNPDPHWSISTGFGYLHQPEAADPGHSMHRQSLSIQHGTATARGGQWASTLLWSTNLHSDEPGRSHSVLAESEWVIDQRNTVMLRTEFVQKSAEDLVLDTGASAFPSDRRFDVGHASVGYIRELANIGGSTLGLGARGTVNLVPSALSAAYGSRTPLGGLLFVRLRAAGARHAMTTPSSHAGMAMPQ